VAAVSDRWAVGAAYEAYMGRWSRPLARAFVEWLAPAPRAHWLDVGCGTGALTAAICDIGKPASVVACDPSGPFLEAASSTRGIVAAYVWDYVEGMQFLRRFWEVAVALDPHAANLDESKRFSFCNAEELVARFRGAGFGKVDTERAQVVTDFASFDEYWGPFLGRTGPAPSYVASLDPAQRDRLRDALRERLEPAPGCHLSLTASAWMVRGMPAQ
jgi:SAM-dependent methyltransferase